MKQLHEADVESVLAGLGIPYKTEGPRHFSFCCPFHGEKNPSARIDRDSSSGEVQFRCFACNEQGTIAKLVAHEQGFGEDWSKAYDWIRDRCGLKRQKKPGPPSRKRATPAAKDLSRRNRRGSKLDVKLRELHQALLSSSDVLEHLAGRGVTRKVVEEHQLGFLIDKNGEWLTIPLPNGSVKLRAWNKTEQQPKYRYLESGSTACCYPSAGGKGEVVVVESELDALVLCSWGIDAVATLGTSNMTTRFLAETLANASHVIVLPDFDERGLDAAESLQRQALAAGHRISVVHGEARSPKDVGEFVQTMGHEGAEEHVKKLLAEAEEPDELSWEERLDVKVRKDGSESTQKTWNNINLIAENDPWMRQFWMDSRSMTLHRDGRRVNNETDELEVLVHFETKHDMRLSKADAFTAICRAADSNRRDLVREHLDRLPEWDGVERLDRFVGEVIKSRRPVKEIERIMFRKWMVQAMRRAYHRGCKAEQVLILISEQQGIGKSTLGRILASDEFFSDSFSHPNDKDTRIQAHGYWIIELSELDHAFHRERSAATWRNFFSMQSDDVRPAYARHSVQMQRGYVFIATTNSVRIIREDHARRYWPIEADGIDLEKARSWRGQLLAEAKVAMQAGELHYLDADQAAQHREHIENYRESASSHLDVLEELLSRMLNGPRMIQAVSGTRCLALLDIASELDEKGIRLSRQDLGAQLNELGWQKRVRRIAPDGKTMKVWAPGEEGSGE